LDGIAEGDAVVVAANFLIDAESNLKAALGGLAAAPTQAAKGSVSHQASGTLEALDPKNGTVTVTHAPVASLNWPTMTMDFILANPSLTDKLKAGSPIDIEFVERGQTTGDEVTVLDSFDDAYAPGMKRANLADSMGIDEETFKQLAKVAQAAAAAVKRASLAPLAAPGGFHHRHQHGALLPGRPQRHPLRVAPPEPGGCFQVPSPAASRTLSGIHR
jgi:Cu/Ag efflux protein CusF